MYTFYYIISMKRLLVIISKDQQQYANKINDALSQLSEHPEEILVYLDRPSTTELETVTTEYAGNHVTVLASNTLPCVGRPPMIWGTPYFGAGHIRNLALQYAMGHDYDIVIFIDGDCIPEPDLIRGHTDILSSDEPTITVGRRLEGFYGWHDQREKDEHRLIPIFNTQCRVTSEAYFVDSGVLWSCNMGMNREAIEQITKLNLLLYGRSEVFSTDFLGTWGGEDGFLGLEAFYSDIPVVPVCSNGTGVQHEEHPRPIEKYDFINFTPFLEEKREELLYLMASNGMDCNGCRYVPINIILGPRK